MYNRASNLLRHMPIHSPLTRKKLVEIKIKAIHRGLWFTALNRLERACINITTRIVEKVQSVFLEKVLTAIVKKLLDAMENKVEYLMKEIGEALALRISQIAQAWGYISAFKWATDTKFIRYLTIIKMNTSVAHRMQI